MALFFRKKLPVELAEQLLKELDEKIVREEKRFQEERSLQVQNLGEEPQLSKNAQNPNSEHRPSDVSEKESPQKPQEEKSSNKGVAE